MCWQLIRPTAPLFAGNNKEKPLTASPIGRSRFAFWQNLLLSIGEAVRGFSLFYMVLSYKIFLVPNDVNTLFKTIQSVVARHL